MKIITAAFLLLLIFNNSCLTLEISNSIFKCCENGNNGSIVIDCDDQGNWKIDPLDGVNNILGKIITKFLVLYYSMDYSIIDKVTPSLYCCFQKLPFLYRNLKTTIDSL